MHRLSSSHCGAGIRRSPLGTDCSRGSPRTETAQAHTAPRHGRHLDSKSANYGLERRTASMLDRDSDHLIDEMERPLTVADTSKVEWLGSQLSQDPAPTAMRRQRHPETRPL